MEGRTDGSVTISLRNFVGEGIIINELIKRLCWMDARLESRSNFYHNILVNTLESTSFNGF
jgi:hypothetical protein